VAALRGAKDFIQESREVFQRRRDFMVAMLNDTPGIRCDLPAGAFYAFADCSALIGKVSPRGRGLFSDEDVAHALLDEANVAVVPGSAFGLAGYLRIAYALDDESLRAACEAIRSFCLKAK
jgi:aspartate aminotransferase